MMHIVKKICIRMTFIVNFLTCYKKAKSNKKMINFAIDRNLFV